MPTSKPIIRKMLKLADLKPDEILIDLGSGDGRTLIIAAIEFKAKAIGIELNPLLVAYSNIHIFAKQLQDQVQVRWGNIFLRSISEADVVTMYLLQQTNNRMKEKLKKELKPGARIVSYVYKFEDWEPHQIDEGSKLYLYKI